jgi:arylsulfatase
MRIGSSTYMMGPVQFFVADMAQSLEEFPRRQEPPSFSIDRVVAKLQAGVGSS